MIANNDLIMLDIISVIELNDTYNFQEQKQILENLVRDNKYSWVNIYHALRKLYTYFTEYKSSNNTQYYDKLIKKIYKLVNHIEKSVFGIDDVA